MFNSPKRPAKYSDGKYLRFPAAPSSAKVQNPDLRSSRILRPLRPIRAPKPRFLGPAPRNLTPTENLFPGPRTTGKRRAGTLARTSDAASRDSSDGADKACNEGRS